jgi:hypothetical protein
MGGSSWSMPGAPVDESDATFRLGRQPAARRFKAIESAEL